MTKSFISLVILDIQTEVLWGSGKIKNTHIWSRKITRNYVLDNPSGAQKTNNLHYILFINHIIKLT